MNRLEKLIWILPVPRFRRALWKTNTAAAIEHVGYLSKNVFDVIIEVGANRGQFSLVAREIHPNAIIYAFEPLPLPGNTYSINFHGDPKAKLFRVAVMPTEDKRIINVSRRDDSSSLLSITEQQTVQFPGTEAVSQTKISCGSLPHLLRDESIAGRTLMKIDVQGAELEVLRCAEPLFPLIGAIYVELSLVQFYGGQPVAAEIIAYLADRGFSIDGVYNPTIERRSGALLQADFSFCHRAKGL